MSRRTHRRLSNPLPFWLLIAAWFCANSPQIATYAIITWMAHGSHFSHQQQLKRDVAFLLAGQKQTSHLLAHAAQHAAETPPPAIPATAVLKKIDLTTEAIVNVSPPADRADGTRKIDRIWAGALRAPPPHGPPRSGTVA